LPSNALTADAERNDQLSHYNDPISSLHPPASLCSIEHFID